MRLAANLLPLVENAPSPRRVVTVLAGGKEGRMYADDIPGRKVPFRGARAHLCSAMTLSLEALGARYPGVSFIHDYPGFVNTNLIRKDEGVLLVLLGCLFALMPRRHTYVGPDECGERHTFLCLSRMYPPRRRRSGDNDNEEEGDGLEVAAARGVDGVVGSGLYSVDEFGEPVPEVVEALRGYREEGMAERVWGHVEGEFVRICGRKAI